MAVASWDYPNLFQISDANLGELDLNAAVTLDAGQGIYLLNPQGCRWEVPLRLTNTNFPQKDGTQLHTRFLEGAEMTLAVQMWETLDDVACDELLQDMVDNLRRHIRQLVRPPLWTPGPVVAQDPRIYWTPDGEAERMLKNVRLQETTEQTLENNVTQIVFKVKSFYPYAMDAAEITDNPPDTLVNGGSADFWPVIKVNGPTSAFIITNQSILDDDGAQLEISYDGSQIGASAIGGGNYVEIDTFFETLYLNGSGANMKPGLVMADTTFWPIAVGSNQIIISGATADILWQNAWY